MPKVGAGDPQVAVLVGLERRAAARLVPHRAPQHRGRADRVEAGQFAWVVVKAWSEARVVTEVVLVSVDERGLWTGLEHVDAPLDEPALEPVAWLEHEQELAPGDRDAGGAH